MSFGADASMAVFPGITTLESARMRELIKAYCGLRVDDGKLLFALQRAWPTLSAMGVQDTASLLRELDGFTGRAWARLLPFLTINETYFMRESGQLMDFVEQAVPELRRRARARGELTLKVLSAACSTGEEPYSLAMLLTEAGCRSRVTGADIDPEALARAQAAIYGPNSFRGCSSAWREARFEPLDERSWWVHPAFRELVAFKRANLLEAERSLGPGRFDAIFCRNVLIYFDRPTQLEVIRQLRGLLVPGGYLLLGHSEMFFDVDLGLEVHATARSTMYRKPEAP